MPQQDTCLNKAALGTGSAVPYVVKRPKNSSIAIGTLLALMQPVIRFLVTSRLNKEKNLKHPITIALLCVAVVLAARHTGAQTSSATPQAAQNPQTEKMRSKVKRIGTRGKLTIKLSSGAEYHGTIIYIDEEDFKLDEVDLRQTVVVRYSDIIKVYEGYGGKSLSGRRVNPKHSAIIALATLGGLLGFLIWFTATQTK